MGILIKGGLSAEGLAAALQAFDEMLCPDCEGDGEVDGKECSACNGEGLKAEDGTDA